MLWRYDPLGFESDVFGAPVGRVVPSADGGDPLATTLQGWLVSARIDAVDEAAARDLADCGFTLIETLITLEAPLPHGLPMSDGIGLARAEDHSACLDIARTAFSMDRFHADARVPKAGADRLKETWVRNSLNGRADAVLVAQDENGVAVGFVTCMVDGDTAVIDLIAVAPGRQGQGIGARLVQGAFAHYTGNKARMRVGTQDSNAASLALYKGQGFVPIGSHRTFHWINESEAP